MEVFSRIYDFFTTAILFIKFCHQNYGNKHPSYTAHNENESQHCFSSEGKHFLFLQMTIKTEINFCSEVGIDFFPFTLCHYLPLS